MGKLHDYYNDYTPEEQLGHFFVVLTSLCFVALIVATALALVSG